MSPQADMLIHILILAFALLAGLGIGAKRAAFWHGEAVKYMQVATSLAEHSKELVQTFNKETAEREHRIETQKAYIAILEVANGVEAPR